MDYTERNGIARPWDIDYRYRTGAGDFRTPPRSAAWAGEMGGKGFDKGFEGRDQPMRTAAALSQNP